MLAPDFIKSFYQLIGGGIYAGIVNPISINGVGVVLIGGSLVEIVKALWEYLFCNGENEDIEESEFYRMRNRFEKIFRSKRIKNGFDVYPKLMKIGDNSLGRNYIIKLPTGIIADDIRKVKEVIENELRYKITISSNYDSVCVQAIEKPLGENYELKKYMSKVSKDKDKADFVIGVIKDEDGEHYPVLNLTSTFCHLLIAGINGSGKSGCFKNIFAQLAYKDIDIWILDMKHGAETRALEDIRCIKRYEYVTERSPQFISALNVEMRHRYDILGEARCKDYMDYNKKFPSKKIKPLVVMIEEISNLNAYSEDASNELRQIMMMSRAANINVVATIQRPDSKMLNSASKSQFQNRISFRQVDEINSKIALGNDLAVEMLKGEPAGRGIIQTETMIDKMFQSFYIEDDDLLHLLKDKIKPRSDSIVSNESARLINIDDVVKGKPIIFNGDIGNKLIDIQTDVHKKHSTDNVNDIDKASGHSKVSTSDKSSVEDYLVFTG